MPNEPRQFATAWVISVVGILAQTYAQAKLGAVVLVVVPLNGIDAWQGVDFLPSPCCSGSLLLQILRRVAWCVGAVLTQEQDALCGALVIVLLVENPVVDNLKVLECYKVGVAAVS